MHAKTGLTSRRNGGFVAEVRESGQQRRALKGSASEGVWPLYSKNKSRRCEPCYFVTFLRPTYRREKLYDERMVENQYRWPPANESFVRFCLLSFVFQGLLR